MSRTIGPLEVVEILGEGSFGTVCVARMKDDPLRRKIAIKVLKRAYTRHENVVRRTRDEARLLSRINHPNIVRVERLLEVRGRPVVVMEHIVGVSLGELLLRYRTGLPASVALAVTRQACLALDAAYRGARWDDGNPMRVIHRDIKPGNIMLSLHGEVKVCDFGIARGQFEGREARTHSVVVGTRPYMAPERLDGVEDHPSVDVYSTGMSMYELLTGRRMSLSINPVTHEEALADQLRWLDVEDMTDEGVARVRKLLGRMLDYVSDHRPSAREVALELEDLRRFVMPQRRIDLIDFADDAVRSLMDAQPPVPFEDAVDDLEDREFFTASEPPPRSRHQSTSWRSRALVAGSAVVFFAVGAVAVARLAADAGSTPVVPEASGLAVVKVWFPPDATARIGEYRIEPGQHIEIPVGPAVLDIRCEDGSTHQCAFHAIDGSAVRLFELRGQRGITVNDGDFLPCEP